jgi:hypothetical protein
MKSVLIYGLALSLLFTACKENTSHKYTLPPAKAEKTLVYRLLPHQLGTQFLPNTLLDSLAALGVNTLLLEGVFFRPNDSLRLAYDWFTPDPSFGNMALLKSWVDSAHSRGLYVWIDFPVNAFYQTPAWFKEIQHSAHAIDLNHAATQEKITTYFKQFLDEVPIDGFWLDKRLTKDEKQLQKLFSELKTAKKILFAGNFDASSLDIKLHEPSTQFVRTLLNDTLIALPSVPTWTSNQLQLSANANDRSPHLAVQKLHFLLSAMLPGPLMLTAGEEVGQLPNPYSQEISWTSNPDLRRFYKQLLHLKKTENSLQTDDFRLLDSGNENILLIGRADWLIIINRSHQDQNWQLPVAYANQQYKDLLNKRNMKLESALFMLQKSFYLLKVDAVS